MLQTKLIFRTPAGAEVVHANSTQTLVNNLVVKNYPEIRLLCGNRTSSPASVEIKLTLVEGREFIGRLDTITLAPGESFTTVYPIPGTKISISATAGDGDAYIDLFVYASAPNSMPNPCYDRCY